MPLGRTAHSDTRSSLEPLSMKTRFSVLAVMLGLILTARNQVAQGQGYGSDTQNVLTPAAGGMAGASLALPQDVPAAIFGNPATLARFRGTQFTLGGAWVEGYPTVTNNGSLNQTNPGQPFSVTSRTEGFANPAIGVVQDLRPAGLPGTFGMGFSGLSGLGSEYRGRVPESSVLDNVSNEYMVLGVNMAAGFELTDQLSAGAALTLGTGFEQLGFVGPLVSSAMVHDYALRGTLGLDYDLNECNTVGFFYQTKMDFQFPNAVRIGGGYHDLSVDQPQTFGLGLANRSLLDGDLLIAADVYYKLWDDAALWQDVLVNQWAFAVGTQLTRGKMKYRLGYSYNSNPINHSVGDHLDGFPIGQANVQLFQAASVPLVNQHRLTGGVGLQGFLVPSLDLDLFAGGLFKGQDEFGASTASVALYYIGMGMTWRYGDCRRRP
jgi:long-chain fatty acid transport protein